MHKEILTTTQEHLLPLVKNFSKDFFLVGGTAIALHLGHRRSIDFDLFSFSPFINLSIKKRISRKATIDHIFVNRMGELTMDVAGVRMTFFEYPFHIPLTNRFEDSVRMPDLLTLAAMKAHALGQRAKWKDYVDLYFIMKKYHGVGSIARKAKQLFGNEFNEKIFRVQLAYFQDVNYSEKVVYMKGYSIPDATVRKKLLEWSIAK
ncbi:MAG: nucleotidyl transferase AbiEii/AbiGii toxin family protein [bacterium]|nr:nucleotidyl transferase AbiEii/AbiGii toxin family protein [bacterium]